MKELDLGQVLDRLVFFSGSKSYVRKSLVLIGARWENH